MRPNLLLKVLALSVAASFITGCGGGGAGGSAGTNGYVTTVVNQSVFLVGPEDSYVAYDAANTQYLYYTAPGASPIVINQTGMTPRGILSNNRVYWLDSNSVKVWGTNGNVATFTLPAGFQPIVMQSDGRIFCQDTTDDNKVYQVFNTFPSLLGKPRAGANLHESQFTVPFHRPVVNTTDGSDNVVMVYDGPNWRELGTDFVALNTDATGRVFGVNPATNAPTLFFDTFNRATYATLTGATASYALAAPNGSAVIGVSFGGVNGATPTEWRGGIPTAVNVAELTTDYTFSHYVAFEEKAALVYTHNVSGDPLSIIFSP